MINDEDSLLNKANRELYTDIQSPTNTPRSFIHDKKIDVPKAWQNNSETPQVATIVTPPRKTSAFKKIFFGALAFLVIAVGIAAFSFLQGINNISSRNVVITLTTRPFVDGGEVFPVNVEIVNRNRISLETATLTLEYPEGNAQNPDAMARIERELGILGSGDTHQESFDVALFGEEGSTRSIRASLAFRVAGSNVIYNSQGITELVIRSSPVLLTADIPDGVTPNQEIPFKFTIVGNGTTVLRTTALVVRYPDGFNFIRADVNPTFENNIWFLGDLPPGVNRTITIYGTVSGGVNELKTIQASVGIQDPRNERLLSTVYNTVSETIPLTNTFLSIRTSVSGNSTATIPVSATSASTVNLEWTNMLQIPITNVELQVKLSGSAYDNSRVQVTNGLFNPDTDTITWSRQQLQELASIDPGETGSLSFSLTPKPSISGTNPSIDLVVNASAFDSMGERLRAERLDVKKLILNSDLNLIARTLYHGGALQNTGPVPPKVGQETTYTIDWQITNSRNRISNARVTTVLPIGVVWKNVVVPQSEQSNISYNTVTREVVWQAGDISSGSGSTPQQVSFKVAITPNSGQIEEVPRLTNEVNLTAYDEFTKESISITRQALTTRLLNDASTVGADGVVTP